jgi:hypothetical protein
MRIGFDASITIEVNVIFRQILQSLFPLRLVDRSLEWKCSCIEVVQFDIYSTRLAGLEL